MTARKPRFTADAQPRANGTEHLTTSESISPMATPHYAPNFKNGHDSAHDTMEVIRKVSWLGSAFQTAWPAIAAAIIVIFGAGVFYAEMKGSAKQTSVDALEFKVDAAATQASVDALKVAMNTASNLQQYQITQFTKILEKIDIRLGDIEASNNAMGVWATRIQDQIEYKLAAAPQRPITPVAAVASRKKAPKRGYPF